MRCSTSFCSQLTRSRVWQARNSCFATVLCSPHYFSGSKHKIEGLHGIESGLCWYSLLMFVGEKIIRAVPPGPRAVRLFATPLPTNGAPIVSAAGFRVAKSEHRWRGYSLVLYTSFSASTLSMRRRAWAFYRLFMLLLASFFEATAVWLDFLPYCYTVDALIFEM